MCFARVAKKRNKCSVTALRNLHTHKLAVDNKASRTFQKCILWKRSLTLIWYLFEYISAIVRGKVPAIKKSCIHRKHLSWLNLHSLRMSKKHFHDNNCTNCIHISKHLKMTFCRRFSLILRKENSDKCKDGARGLTAEELTQHGRGRKDRRNKTRPSVLLLSLINSFAHPFGDLYSYLWSTYRNQWAKWVLQLCK